MRGNMIDVWLYRVGRNLNRAYRTCASFGVERLVLVDCGEVSGRLYSAEGRVEVVRADALPSAGGTLVLEDYAPLPLQLLAWHGVERIVVGGETSGIPRSFRAERAARIVSAKPSLTVEASLAIALFEWSLA